MRYVHKTEQTDNQIRPKRWYVSTKTHNVWPRLPIVLELIQQVHTICSAFHVPVEVACSDKEIRINPLALELDI